MATATKASLQAELLAAQAELAVAREQLTALSEQQDAPRTDELSQTLWLLPIKDGQGKRINQATGKVSFRFAAQIARRDNRSGKYNYGPARNFVAYNNGFGDLADAIEAIYESTERRVRITAFEVPWVDGSYRSDWTVTSLQVQQRTPATQSSHQEVIDPEVL